jgi:putative FmdB family regulatory protein
MPTYEYRCSLCHEVSDAFQKMSDPALVDCPFCGKPGLERIVSGGAGVLYKGEGWYVTDYSKKSSGGKEESSKPVGEKSKTETASQSAESNTETESKPAEKPATKPKADTATSKSE